jgi:hypothetical protein
MPFVKGQSGNPKGRTPKAEKFAGQIAKAEGRIAKNLVRYIENMEALADGVFVEEIDETGKRTIYQRPPDRAANEYLINRVMGKPTERREISGPDAGPLPIAFDHGAALADLAPGSAADFDEPGADEGDRDG